MWAWRRVKRITAASEIDKGRRNGMEVKNSRGALVRDVEFGRTGAAWAISKRTVRCQSILRMFDISVDVQSTYQNSNFEH